MLTPLLVKKKVPKPKPPPKKADVSEPSGKFDIQCFAVGKAVQQSQPATHQPSVFDAEFDIITVGQVVEHEQTGERGRVHDFDRRTWRHLVAFDGQTQWVELGTGYCIPRFSRSDARKYAHIWQNELDVLLSYLRVFRSLRESFAYFDSRDAGEVFVRDVEEGLSRLRIYVTAREVRSLLQFRLKSCFPCHFNFREFLRALEPESEGRLDKFLLQKGEVVLDKFRSM
jgi:hypothetical protein